MRMNEIVAERMKLLGIDIDVLVDEFFFEKEFIDALLRGEIDIKNMDDYDIAVLSNALHCTPEVFYDEMEQQRDLLLWSLNRGEDNRSSIDAKLYVQEYVRDFLFIESILEEEQKVNA